MTLLSWEDYVLEDGEEGGVWVEVKVRALVPIETLRRKGARAAIMRADGAGPWTTDTMASAQIGDPVECPQCGKVAVRFGSIGTNTKETPFYPFGFDRYGLLKPRSDKLATRVVAGQYCPRCDGKEDSP